MSTPSVTPDVSQVQVDPSALSAPAQRPAQQAAQAFQDNTSQPSASSGGVATSESDARETPPQSRLGAILGAVARTVSTGLAGVPDKGRPSFVTGLGQGARAEQAAEATQQAIKFR